MFWPYLTHQSVEKESNEKRIFTNNKTSNSQPYLVKNLTEIYFDNMSPRGQIVFQVIFVL